MTLLHAIKAVVMITALWAAGCAAVPRLAPVPPAAPPLPAVLTPEPLAPLPAHPPFGLYAITPEPATLEQLAHGLTSPDQRYRLAHAAQGLWVARSDGAWFWQVQLPAPSEPKAPPLPPGTHPPPSLEKPKPTAPQAPPVMVGVARWTDRSTLLLRDNQGGWYEADPLMARVEPLPAPFRGAEELTLSPDGRKVLYYAPGRKGRQLWTANADGSSARSHGENLAGSWNPDSTLKTEPLSPQVPVGNPNHPANIPM